MRLQSKKLIAVLCALAMIISVFPVQADAAAKPKFVKNYTVLYEKMGMKTKERQMEYIL